jgi:hypothetical protein
MKTKLTLRMEHAVIERAKAYAAQRGASVSELVENYFRLLATDRPEGGDGAAPDPSDNLPPITRSLVGIAAGSDVDEDDYKEYLVQKYG